MALQADRNISLCLREACIGELVGLSVRNGKIVTDMFTS